MDILSPAGSPQALKAAVYAGADAIYLGAEEFNARTNASNFTNSQIMDGIKFCHERGVKVHAVLNTLVSDREMNSALKIAEIFANAGADAFIVQDIGLATELKKNTNIPLHASTQMTVNNLDDVLALQDMGFARIVISRELSKKNIQYITKSADAEIEIFVHGAMCMSYSGQCYMSSVIGGRSGNRGCCAQPCRLPYRNGYQLSLKDMCLLKYVKEFESEGIACIKIEGRMKSPEYVYAVTKAYADVKRGTPYIEETEEYLTHIFSRDGFTDGYYTENRGISMFGMHEKSTITAEMQTKEYKRIGITFNLKSDDEDNVTAIGITGDGYAAETSFVAQKAQTAPTDKEAAERAFSKLGDTVYYLDEFKFDIHENLFMPVSVLNNARRRILEQIRNMRLINDKYMLSNKTEPIPTEKCADTPFVEAQFKKLTEIPDNASKLDLIWLPLTCVEDRAFDDILNAYSDNVGVYMPRIADDNELFELKRLICIAKNKGIRRVLSGTLGQLNIIKAMELEIHADFGLNIFNSHSKSVLQKFGFKTCTLSFELKLAQIKDIADNFCTVIAYGRLPFMYTRNCIKSTHHKDEFLYDRKNKAFLVTCEYGCRNQIWNADKLYLADKHFDNVGRIRLIFTDENQAECARVICDYIDGQNIVPPKNITRGLYYK